MRPPLAETIIRTNKCIERIELVLVHAAGKCVPHTGIARAVAGNDSLVVARPLQTQLTRRILRRPRRYVPVEVTDANIRITSLITATGSRVHSYSGRPPTADPSSQRGYDGVSEVWGHDRVQRSLPTAITGRASRSLSRLGL